MGSVNPMQEIWRPMVIGEKIKKNREKLFLATLLFLVALLSFEAGLLHKSLAEAKPIIIHTSTDGGGSTSPPNRIPVSVNKSDRDESSSKQDVQSSTSSCVYVGSKKSTKYHLPTSRCAKQIKPENRICFESKEAAEAHHYIPGCLQ